MTFIFLKQSQVPHFYRRLAVAKGLKKLFSKYKMKEENNAIGISDIPMPPNQTVNLIRTPCDDYSEQNLAAEKPENKIKSRQEIIWVNTIAISLFHIIATISFFFIVFKMKILTFIWSKSSQISNRYTRLLLIFLTSSLSRYSKPIIETLLP